MAVIEKQLKEFVETLVVRGIGLYGQNEMAKICYDSGIGLLDDNQIEWMEENYEENVKKLIINYAGRNLPAKMTAIVLAKQHNIPVPDELTKKKKRKKTSWFRRILK